MKKLLFVFALVALTATMSLAQQSKADADKKALKKELKQYRKMKPMQVRQMKLNYEAKLANMDVLQKELAKSQAREDSIQRLYNASSSRMKMMEKEVANSKSASSMSSGSAADMKGITFRVQIGAYAKHDAKDKFKSGDQTVNAENVGGLDKYSIGLFRNFAEAEAFKNEVRRLGIKDAFVVAYNDGVRVPMSQAMSGQGK